MRKKNAWHKKINNALKIIIKLSVKSVSFKFFFFLSLSVVCSISTVLLRLTDVDENVMETALSRSVTCKLKCTGFMQILDFFPPIQYPDIAFFFLMAFLGDVKPLV